MNFVNNIKVFMLTASRKIGIDIDFKCTSTYNKFPYNSGGSLNVTTLWSTVFPVTIVYPKTFAIIFIVYS